ncbi:hypothetical protein A2311_03820 [candidate division WOR-1 bacterium RIFOXYB2_FULL_48_7]|uniref:Methyltransferase n=1 Tax=candidate division WOR-1 bacterium RIFOXYB2_FULL_48_7 TaxID=1802583 RepID=A0A1F4TF40_UNCSA|nr:MAG: hypothetical protein A2311_03820 [candidate division WOR-1 bacterium RIFOXYB2_FULL_48_7]
MLVMIASAAIKLKAPFHHLSSPHFGPRARHISILDFKATDRAAQEIELHPGVALPAFGGYGLGYDSIVRTADSSVAFVITREQNAIFFLPEELASEVVLSEHTLPDIPHSDQAVLCLAEIYQREDEQCTKEDVKNFFGYRYADPPELCQPYQRIYGGKGRHRIPIFLNQLQAVIPDIYAHSFADLGGAFGWPMNLWSQYLAPGLTAAMFESRPELVEIAKASAERLSAMGVDLSRIKINGEDFLKTNLSCFGVLHAYWPFVVNPTDPDDEAAEDDCYRVIYQMLRAQNWPGRYLIFNVTNNHDPIAREFGYHPLGSFRGGKRVYEKISASDKAAT